MLSFHLSGVIPVAHMTFNSMWMHSLYSRGIILSSSFSTPSGPGAFPLLKVRKHSSKTVGSLILVCSCGRVARRVACVSS